MSIVSMLVVGSVASGQVDGIPDPVRTITISGSAQLQQALSSAKPGDHLVLADGEFNGQFELSKNGTAENPIVIKAANILKVAFHQKFIWTGDHNIIWGLNLDGNADGQRQRIAIEGANAKVLRCKISCFRVDVRAPNMEFAYNDMSNWGDHLGMIVRPVVNKATNAHIQRNHFHDSNGGEKFMEQGVCIGNAELPETPANAVIEYNLFERMGHTCSFETKASHVTFRYNTIIDAARIIVRWGHHTKLLGNWSESKRGLGYTTGATIHGHEHKIIGNGWYGTARLRLLAGSYGSYTLPPKQYTRGFRPAAADCLLAWNDAPAGMDVGFFWGSADFPAKDNKIEAHTGPIKYVQGQHTGTVVSKTTDAPRIKPIKLTPKDVGPYAPFVRPEKAVALADAASPTNP